MVPYITDKARKAIFATVRKCASAGLLTPKVALELFDTNVLPVLNYASEFWCKERDIVEVERVQLKFLKYVLGVKISTCSLAVYGELVRFPIHLQHMVKLLKYWIRILSFKEDHLVKIAFNTLKHLDDAGHTSWASKIKYIQKNHDLEAHWEDNHFVLENTEQFILNFKEQAYNNFIKEWHTNIATYPKLRTYIIFKQEFNFEKYLLEVKDFKLRKSLSKLRLSSCDLQIEKGRYERQKPADRLCKLCNANSIEDEIHVVTVCVAYNDLRLKFANEIEQTLNFAQIMGSNNIRTIFCLCKFIQNIFKRRQHLLSRGL